MFINSILFSSSSIIQVTAEISQVNVGAVLRPDAQAIICISRGYQDLLLGLYQVFTVIWPRIFKFESRKPIRDLLVKKNQTMLWNELNPNRSLQLPNKLCYVLHHPHMKVEQRCVILHLMYGFGILFQCCFVWMYCLLFWCVASIYRFNVVLISYLNIVF